MANNLINDRPEFPAQPIQQHAEKIVNVEHANTIQTSNTIYIATGLPGGPGFQTTPFCFSRDYYNLVIFGNTPFTHEDHITLTKDRCLVELKYITEELRDRFSPLTSEIIAELKSFLCIVTSENMYYGWTDKDHFALIAQLLEVKNRSNGIQLYFRPIFQVPQTWISEHLFELGICGRYKRFNELNHSHWTVKEIDLMEVLNDAGLNPFSR